ncbi:MAG: hypothetical protein RMM06_03415 [Armatimonadota bacterium]|nr:hypothetical protein [bacterium]MCS7309337.1 hypothetical protein [Armatimonadota bacterium]MDW8103732.1 hypothetical protein [Armatimonadota bacterium]MDW8289743.1 hypothetical protein [Armatimonadota bacterium]
MRAESELPTPPPVWTAPPPPGFEAVVLPPIAPTAASVVVTPQLHQSRVARRDPKHGWHFQVACYGYFRTEHQNHPELRFRVYAQQTEDLPAALQVCRLLLRLQEVAWQRLRLQVNLQGERVLNVWLCRQGNAGGEQWRNNLYLYSVQEIHAPMQWLREVAHEFSHALFPGITGYTSPEPWANGYIGERLLLSWLQPMLEGGALTPEDLCGASATEVSQFVQQRCLPLRQMWASGGFPQKEFSRTDATGMGALVGLVLYIDSVYGSAMLRATFARLQAPQPHALWRAFTEAVREAQELRLTPVGNATQVWLAAAGWRVDSEDKMAMLQRGKRRWQATQQAWQLSESDWYRLTSKASLRLSKP